MTEPTLFDAIDDAAKPARALAQTDHPDTAKQAAELHPLVRSGIRRRVAVHLRSAPAGLTDDEIHDRGTGTRHRHSTATRRGELVAAGLAVDTGSRRLNQDGNADIVWQWCGGAV